MYCETCPIRDHCSAYEEAEKENDNSYHRQAVIRVNTYSEPSCPLLELIKLTQPELYKLAKIISDEAPWKIDPEWQAMARKALAKVDNPSAL